MSYLKSFIFLCAVFIVFALIAHHGFYAVIESIVFPNEDEAYEYYASLSHLLTAPWVFFGVPILATSILGGIYACGTKIWFRIVSTLFLCACLWAYFASTYDEIGVLSALDLKAIVYINGGVIPALLLWQFIQRRKRENA